MALRRTTQSHTQQAKLLVLPSRADALRAGAMRGLAAKTDEAVLEPSLADHTHSTNRKLRNMIILANFLAWIVIAFAIRLVFF